MSTVNKEIKPVKALKDEIQYYIIDPNQAVLALNNYHRNKRVDKYLELSKTKELKIDGKTYKRKEHLNEVEYKVLYGIQRELERLNSKLTIVNMNAQSITRRLQNHGDKMTASEMKVWRTQWTELSTEYDKLISLIEKKTDESREKTLLYTFRISRKVFLDNYMLLLDYADGIYLAIINLYDIYDPTRIGDVIAPLTNEDMPDPSGPISNLTTPNVFEAVESK